MKISKQNKTQVLAYNNEDDELIIADPVRGTTEYSVYNRYEVLDQMMSEMTCEFQQYTDCGNIFIETNYTHLGENSFILTDGLDHLTDLGLREDAIKLTDEFFKD